MVPRELADLLWGWCCRGLGGVLAIAERLADDEVPVSGAVRDELALLMGRVTELWARTAGLRE